MAWGAAAGNIYNPDPSYNDPIMGNGLYNCSFVAGLSSLAWINPTSFIKNNLPNSGPNLYKANFFNWMGLWGYNPNIWAPSTDTCHSADPVEIWPAYYEKAYASCKLGTHDNPTIEAYRTAVNSEVVSTIPLNKLTTQPWQGLTGCPQNFYKFLNDNNFLTAPSTKAGLGYYSRQLKRPMIVGIPGVGAAGHAYSVLGTYDPTNNPLDGGKYIILRNPTGGGAPGGQTLARASWWANWAPYLGGAPQAAPVWKEIPLNSGVFGILNDNFGIFAQYTYCSI